MKVLSAIQPTIRKDFVAIGNESIIWNGLQKRAWGLYSDSISMFQPKASPSFHHSTQMSVNSHQHNNLVEVDMITPVPCSMESISKMLWKELNSVRQYPDKWYQTVRTAEKKYTMLVRNQSQMLELTGMQFGCRFDEPTRTVFVAADTMLIGTIGLQFWNNYWIVVSPSSIDPVNSSVVSMCVRLSAHTKEEFSEDITFVKDMVLTNLCSRFRQFSQFLQNWLVEEAERMRQ
ncbi:unnamed protein product [Phytophthora fragariaefolia]|uniref:Unnamed protein product n=1 Tax=Phytophthora fragariaefolia TaxID=1490495 RepID=A0A9W6U513_9STRA|nr:unnamed protein product [Phytophthora fragariaefolia]